ncbi:MAG: hypothetical protein JW763_08440 [candidate division Zixibacteria bacterium]|nr:hypothetical protein [candidate division Zixibacteria bacterium]
MTDDEIRHLISRYLDDRLTDDDRREVERLIAESGEYAEYYRQLRALANQVDKFEMDSSDAYWETRKDVVLDRIEQIEEKKITRVPSGPMPALYKWLAVAASIALVAFISINESQNIPWIKGMFESKKTAPAAVYKSTSDNGKAEAGSPMGNQTQELADHETAPAENEMTNEWSADSDKDRPVAPEIQMPSVQQKAKTPSTAETDVKKPTPENIGHVVDVKAKMPDESLVTKPSADVDSEIKTKASQLSPEPTEPPSPERRAEVVRQKPSSLVQSDIAQSISVEGISGDVDTISARAKHDNLIQPEHESRHEPDMVVESMHEMAEKSLPGGRDDSTSIALWQNRLDSLMRLHGDIMPARERLSAAKGTMAEWPDSSSAVLLSYAEAYYHLGLLAKSERERREYVNKLQTLQNQVDSAKSEIIATFIDRIRSLK